MSWRKQLKRLCSFAVVVAVLFVAFQIWMVRSQAKDTFAVDSVSGEWQVVIVPGASVLRSGQPSDVLADRLLTALEVYKAGKAEKFLLSGDNGQAGYNEVASMRDYLLERDVPGEDIFLDHAGFDTYDTLYRAKAIFGVSSAVIVTQKFHLPRALFIADALHISAIGVIADRQPYVKALIFSAREWPARFKALLDVIFKSKPAYLGDPIDLSGDGRSTWDDAGGTL